MPCNNCWAFTLKFFISFHSFNYSSKIESRGREGTGQSVPSLLREKQILSFVTTDFFLTELLSFFTISDVIEAHLQETDLKETQKAHTSAKDQKEPSKDVGPVEV